MNSQMKSLMKKLRSSRELSLFLVLAVLCIAVQLRNNSFLTAKTIGDMLKNYSTTITLALGMMSVLLIGGIDISVASSLAFSGMCASLMMRDGVYSSTLIMFLVSIGIGMCCGMIVGFVMGAVALWSLICAIVIQWRKPTP